jgi:hypothetical protein
VERLERARKQTGKTAEENQRRKTEGEWRGSKEPGNKPEKPQKKTRRRKTEGEWRGSKEPGNKPEDRRREPGNPYKERGSERAKAREETRERYGGLGEGTEANRKSQGNSRSGLRAREDAEKPNGDEAARISKTAKGGQSDKITKQSPRRER